jgi:hypothetical protein
MPPFDQEFDPKTGLEAAKNRDPLLAEKERELSGFPYLIQLPL